MSQTWAAILGALAGALATAVLGVVVVQALNVHVPERVNGSPEQLAQLDASKRRAEQLEAQLDQANKQLADAQERASKAEALAKEADEERKRLRELAASATRAQAARTPAAEPLASTAPVQTAPPRVTAPVQKLTGGGFSFELKDCHRGVMVRRSSRLVCTVVVVNTTGEDRRLRLVGSGSNSSSVVDENGNERRATAKIDIQAVSEIWRPFAPGVPTAIHFSTDLAQATSVTLLVAVEGLGQRLAFRSVPVHD